MAAKQSAYRAAQAKRRQLGVIGIMTRIRHIKIAARIERTHAYGQHIIIIRRLALTRQRISRHRHMAHMSGASHNHRSAIVAPA